MRLTSIARTAFVVFGLACVANASFAQEPEKIEIAYARDALRCQECHLKETTPEHIDFLKKEPFKVWDETDKHKEAFRNLVARGNIELTNRILGFKLEDAFAKLPEDAKFVADKSADAKSFDKWQEQTQADMFNLSSDEAVAKKVDVVRACLKCHATTVPAEIAVAAAPVPAAQPTFELPVAADLGVACESCHGPAKGWIDDPHVSPYWRLVSPEDKTKFGFRDLRDPVVKAQVCSSCHVGNIDQGKFVKHEWYAKGHPPLPSFELSTFAEQMPAHWVPLAKKGDFNGRTAESKPINVRGTNLKKYQDTFGPIFKANYQAANFPGERNFDPFAQLPRFQESLVGSVVSLQSHVGLLTAMDPKAENAAPFADFSYFDCMSCHHELKASTKAARPMRRGYAGRPPLPLWPTIQLKTAVAHLADAKGRKFETDWQVWEKKFATLEEALTIRPFGDAAAVGPAAKSLHEDLGKLALELRDTAFDKKAGEIAIQRLATMGNETRDYNTARHLAWAINGIDKDVNGTPYDPTADKSSLFGKVGTQIFQSGGDYLHLKLPSMQSNFIVDDLPKSLPAAARYDSERFDKDLEKIRDWFKVSAASPSAAVP